MRTDCELQNIHTGHKLKVKGEKFPRTISISWCNNDSTGIFHCPKCHIKEKVQRTGKICEFHEYGEHIEITCQECKTTGYTKNINYIGARTLFISCDCSKQTLIHKCSSLPEGETRK